MVSCSASAIVGIDCFNTAIICHYLGHQPASGVWRSAMPNRMAPAREHCAWELEEMVSLGEEGFVLPSRHPDPL